MRKELESYLDFLRAGGIEEIAYVCVGAAMALRFLKNTTKVTRRFPMGLLWLQQPTGPDERIELLRYATELAMFQRTLKDTAGTNLGVHLIASGVWVWRATCWAAANPRLLALGRQVWAELRRGQPKFTNAIEDMKATNALKPDAVYSHETPPCMIAE